MSAESSSTPQRRNRCLQLPCLPEQPFSIGAALHGVVRELVAAGRLLAASHRPKTSSSFRPVGRIALSRRLGLRIRTRAAGSGPSIRDA